jgi:signal transduction histidine kinase
MTERLAERTRALEELLEAQKEAAGRMQAILSSIGDGVVLEDMDGNFIPLNATAEAMVEEMATDFLNSPLRELAVGEDEDLDARSSPWLLESRRFQVANKILSIHAAAVRTEDGRRLGNVIVLRDVTAEVEAERLKDAFITHVSHELRTPLTAIKGYTDLLLAGARGQLDEKQASFLETISRHTDSLKEMVNELLDLSEVEAGRELGLQREPLTLSSLVEKIADRWRPQMDEKGLEFDVNVPADLPLVNADARRMRWAIINLVRNAWQNTPSGGRVTLRLSSKNGRVVIDVEDTGVGIPPGERQQIFERFYRIQRESENETRGLGLGLYITRAIVEAHDGEIHLDSQEGVGSTFSLVLPVIEPGEEDEEID